MLSMDDQYLAVALVGDIATTAYPDGILSALVDSVAQQYTFDAVYPGSGLDSLYTQRDLIKIALGAVWQLVDQTIAEDKAAYSQRAKALMAMRAAIEAQIHQQLQQALQSGGISVGQMTITAPVSPPVGRLFPDANDPRYRGSPYIRQLKPQS